MYTFTVMLTGGFQYKCPGADSGEVKWVNFHPFFLSLPDDGTITFWAVNIVEDISG